MPPTQSARAQAPARASAPARPHRRSAGPRPHDAARRAHLPPLDGLRGLAVLGVLLFHLGDLPGGFLGVDLFFVLSGFLITGLLLREAAANDGRISLAAFWGRRARRLLPALAAALAGTLVLTVLLGSPAMIRFARQDAPWVVANLANWHFVAEQVGYFQATPTRVFTHLWSIAVEEQFYLLWPPLTLLLLRAGRGAGGARALGPRALAAVAALGAVASAALMALLLNPADTTRVYEGTDTRAFALLLGALAATPVVRDRVARLSERAAGRLALVPAVLLAAAWALVPGTGQVFLFQGGLLLHSAAAAALIGLLARAPGTPVGRVLGLHPLTALGGLSYGLYLWHWPLILLLDQAGALPGWSRTPCLVALSIAVAALSKTLLEDPVRYRARWAHGRAGALAVVATLAALTALWLALPLLSPAASDTPAGPTVDITQLGARAGG
ncbi:acyltransferase family protein [Streptomyces sp. NPDC059917]|uniref:acyltransferase family protein n=1 Tax=Streptomyces sp. NPDC059917 TaxID=3347002 RepID=UPI00366621EC